MTRESDRFYLNAAWLWIIGFSLFRFLYSGLFLLVPDETNYWQWSRHLAFGYHDQAPLIAWTTKLTTSILGQTETGVRLPSVLAIAVASGYLIVLAKRYMGDRAAWNTALLSQAILEFNLGGLLATPDGLQAAAWAGASYHVARAYENDRLSQWLLGGLWFGIGMLSKYTMVIFLPGAFLYGIFSQSHRRRLARFRPYAGVLLGMLMFVPVIIWNAQNHWSSLHHVANLGGVNREFAIDLKFLGDFLASQAGLLSPLMFFLGLLAWYLALQRPSRTEKWIYRFLFFTSFPMFATFTLLSFHTRVYGNWPASGYLVVSVLIGAFFAERSKIFSPSRIVRWGQGLWPWAVGCAYLFSVLVFIQVVWPVFPIPAKWDRIAIETSGWKELGIKAAQTVNTLPNPEKTFLFGLQYQIASELAFYTPGQPVTVSINRWNRPNVYDYWWKDEDLIGLDAVGVTDSPESHVFQLKQVFDQVDPPIRLDIFSKSVSVRKDGSYQPVKTFYIYRAYGFKGGLRWIPPERSDIRAY